MSKVSLSDFIAETLSNISDGVERAKEHSQKSNGIPIAPNNVDGTPLDQGNQLVTFNVTVETVQGTEKGGKGQLGGPLVSVVAGSLDVEGTATNQNTNRHSLQFSVPMHFQMRWAEK